MITSYDFIYCDHSCFTDSLIHYRMWDINTSVGRRRQHKNTNEYSTKAKFVASSRYRIQQPTICISGVMVPCACVPTVTLQNIYRTCIPDRLVPGSCRRSGSPDPRLGTYVARTATARSTAPVCKGIPYLWIPYSIDRSELTATVSTQYGLPPCSLANRLTLIATMYTLSKQLMNNFQQSLYSPTLYNPNQIVSDIKLLRLHYAT